MSFSISGDIETSSTIIDSPPVVVDPPSSLEGFSETFRVRIKLALGYPAGVAIPALAEPFSFYTRGQVIRLLNELDSLFEESTASISDGHIVALEDMRFDYSQQTSKLRSVTVEITHRISLLLGIPLANSRAKKVIRHYQ